MVKQKTQNARVDKARWAAYAAAGVAATLAGTQSADADIFHMVVDSPFSGGMEVNLSLPGGASLNFLNAAGGRDSAVFAVNSAYGDVVGVYLPPGGAPSLYAANHVPGVNIATQNFLIPLAGDPAARGYMVYPFFGAPGLDNSQFANAPGAASNGDMMGGGILAFRFSGDGLGGAGTRYGWVRVTFDADAGTNNFVIEEYAYGMADEDVLTGQTVSAIPEPTSLGLLALGAFGVVANRRRRKLVA